MKNSTKAACYIFLLLLFCLMASLFNSTVAQENKPYVRIAKIVIDSVQLENYIVELKEHAEAAVRKEPGVLTLYAVYDKEHPTNITVFEIYKSVAAYQSHILTPHFLKYKSAVKNMVKSLVLSDVVPIALEAKPKL